MLGLKSPLIVQLELTSNCNHSCTYCYNFFKDSRMSSLSMGSLERITQQLISNEVFSVILTGGEPLLNYDGFNFTMNRLEGTSIDRYVNTNLSTSLDSETLNNLVKSKLVLVSFPSYKSEDFASIVGQNDQSMVLTNLEKLIESGAKVGINQVVTKKNKDQVYQTAQFLYSRFKELKLFSSTPVVAVRQEDKAYELSKDEILMVANDLMKIKKDTGLRVDMLTCIPPCFFPEEDRNELIAMHGCSAGVDMAVIGSEGNVRRCTKLSEDYGNILKENLSEIWSRMQGFVKKESFLCEDCLSPYGCYGGCEIRVNFFGSDPLVRGKDYFQPQSVRQLQHNKIYTISDIKSRIEGERVLIYNGAFVTGNRQLLDFVKSLERKNFNLTEAREKFGNVGVNILTYLYNKGIVKDGI